MRTTRNQDTDGPMPDIDMASARAKVSHARRRIPVLQGSLRAVQKRHESRAVLPDKIKDKSHPVDIPLMSLLIQ
jgi:hypothetical protein